MNRTITMNLGGIIFHIEEDAYDMLNRYLTTIRGYFSASEGREEIMSDIEARIAEMLQEKVSRNKQAVLLLDVEAVIAVMGRPEDFAATEDRQQSAAPEKEKTYSGSSGTRRRRVFRDPDEKILGGVCSGIANYFDFDPLWLRAAFALSFFLYGTGFLLYFILWIIIPEAKTTAEKLEMRGEKVDINNIGKAVNEEFEHFKKKMKDFGDEVGSPETRERIRTNAQKIGDMFAQIIHHILRFAGQAIAILAVVFCIILMIALFGSMAGKIHMNNSSVSVHDLAIHFFPDNISPQLVITGMLLLLGIPLLGIVYSSVRFLLGIHKKHRVVRFTFSVLWLAGLVIMIIAGIETWNGMAEEASVTQKIEIMQKDTLYLNIRNYEKYVKSWYIRRPHSHLLNHVDRWAFVENMNPVTINIVPSETDSFQLEEVRTASGMNKKEAGNLAKNIRYSVTANDSLIEFDPMFQIAEGDKWRMQEVNLILKVPKNKVIFIGKGMGDFIDNIYNVSNTLDNDMVNRRWIMKAEGLTCIDCQGLDTDGSHNNMPMPPTPPKGPQNNY